MRTSKLFQIHDTIHCPDTVQQETEPVTEPEIWEQDDSIYFDYGTDNWYE